MVTWLTCDIGENQSPLNVELMWKQSQEKLKEQTTTDENVNLQTYNDTKKYSAINKFLENYL